MVIKNILGLALAPGWLRQKSAGRRETIHLLFGIILFFGIDHFYIVHVGEVSIPI
jgi:hypothetical protein